MKPKRKAVLYARYSPKPPKRTGGKVVSGHNEDDGDSIDSQLEYCRRYCVLHDLDIDGEYADEGRTGSNMDRPGLQEALDHVCRVQGLLVCYRLDRFSRSTIDCLKSSERLMGAGANLALIRESIDTTSPHGNFFFTIMAALGQMERELISQRTSDAMLYYQDQEGRIMSSNCPYGFKPDPNKPGYMIADEDEQSVLEEIRVLRTMTYSCAAIARILNDRGIKNRKGFDFKRDGVARILRKQGIR